MVEFQFYPFSVEMPEHLELVIEAFRAVEDAIDSTKNRLPSNEVLAQVCPHLQPDYLVETGKAHADRVRMPVLYGRNNTPTKTFDADAWCEASRTVLEVEAGRAIVNNQILKDLFEACVMDGVDYLAIAVRRVYARGKDFETAATFLDTLYASGRLALPLKGILLIGY